MLKAYEVFPESFADHDDRAYSGSSNGVADVLDEVRQATDYLLKTHPDSSTLVVRVGGSQDHDLWVTSPYQSTLSVGQGGGKRPVQTGGRADIAGLAAAALALMSTLTDDAEHAQECLDVAESLYVLGNSRKGTTWDLFYADETWQDDMLCAAVELYRATGYEGYLDDARALDAQIGSHDWVLSWAQVGPLSARAVRRHRRQRNQESLVRRRGPLRLVGQ